VLDLSRLVTIDFETYYDQDYTLRKLSTSEYVRDPRFKVHMMGIKVGRRKVRVVPGPKVKAALAAIDWRTHALLAHNTAFDGFILSQHYGVHPHFLYDTLGMARALHGNEIRADLNAVAAYYQRGNKLPAVLDRSRGVPVLFQDLYDMMAAYCAQDVELCHAVFLDMLKQFPAAELGIIDTALRCFTSPRLHLDVPRAEAELAREIKAREELLFRVGGTKSEMTRMILHNGKDAALEAVRKKIASNASFGALLNEAGVDTPVKISPTTGLETFAFARTDLEFTDLLQHPKKRVRELVEARLMVKSTINETRAGRMLASARSGDGTLPVLYHYYGAHTGRFSAGDKRNYQNLPRGGELRKSLLAPKGRVIAICDSSQIEARVLAWIAGQDDLLEDFRLNDAGLDRDVYCKLADSFYGREITKADEMERQVGKVARLGLGYGMGHRKFQHTLATGAMGPPVKFTLAECSAFVNTYRHVSHRTVQFWRLCDQIILDMAAGREGSYKCLRWGKNHIQLPNGLSLKYPDLRHTADDEGNLGWSYQRRDGRARIYGGLLTENIVQALARIIVVGEQMPVIARRYPVVMTTHDETVTLPTVAGGKRCLDFMIKVMRTPPAWAPDIPLNAEGKVDVFYSK